MHAQRFVLSDQGHPDSEVRKSRCNKTKRLRIHLLHLACLDILPHVKFVSPGFTQAIFHLFLKFMRCSPGGMCAALAMLSETTCPEIGITHMHVYMTYRLLGKVHRLPALVIAKNSTLEITTSGAWCGRSVITVQS